MKNVEKEITELKSVIKEASNKVELLEKSLKETDLSKCERGEKLFVESIQGLKAEYTPEKITHYNKDGEWVIEEDYETGRIWFSYTRFWEKFKPIFGDNYIEIRDFLRGMVSKHMKIEELTPFDGYKIPSKEVSKHMKIEELTPSSKKNV